MSFFQTILDSLSTFGQFILNLVKGIVLMFRIIPEALIFVEVQVGFLPSILLGCVLCAVTVRIVYLILGRLS